MAYFSVFAMDVPQKPSGLFFQALGAFLVLDAVLAVLFGNQYLLWGLEYTPAFYQAMILGLSKSSPPVLFSVKLAEALLGIAFFWLSGKVRQ